MPDNTVGHLLAIAIQQAGGDGLYNVDGDCACSIISGLAPGDCLDLNCTVGRRRTCPKCGNWGTYSLLADKRSVSCWLCGAETKLKRAWKVANHA